MKIGSIRHSGESNPSRALLRFMLLLLYLLSCHLAFFGGFFLLIWIFPSIDDKTKKTSKRVDVHKTGDEMRHAQTVFGDTHKTGPSSMVGIRFRLERKGKWLCYIRTVSIFSSSSASSQAEGITEFFFSQEEKSEGWCLRFWARRQLNKRRITFFSSLFSIHKGNINQK